MALIGWIDNGWTGTLPSGSIRVVPEPSSLALAALALLGIGPRYVAWR